MRILDVEQNSPEWLEARKGKITGSKLKDVVVKRGNGKKIGYYQLIADRLALDDGQTSSRDRGHDLEQEAIEAFEGMTDRTVDRTVGVCVSDAHEGIAVSPDGLIRDDEGRYTEAVEVKCLGSARHIEAILTNRIPDDYYMQALQYFIVIDELEVLYFVFYDPRLAARPLHMVQLTREEVEEEVEEYREYQVNTLKEIDKAVEQLAF